MKEIQQTNSRSFSISRKNGHMLHRLAMLLALVLLLLCRLQSVLAQSFQVTNAIVNTQGNFTVSFPSDPNSFFVLFRGTSVKNITNDVNSVAMVLGQNGGGVLTDTVAAVGAAFYSVLKGPLSQDSVGDGIADWWRAQNFGGSGARSNSSSCATCDPDLDGVNNLLEYLRGTKPNDGVLDNINFYVDSLIGNDTRDGITPTVSGSHGPKLTIQGAISSNIGLSGDNVFIAAGTYAQTLLDSGSKSITLSPQGNVTIQ